MNKELGSADVERGVTRDANREVLALQQYLSTSAIRNKLTKMLAKFSSGKRGRTIKYARLFFFEKL